MALGSARTIRPTLRSNVSNASSEFTAWSVEELAPEHRDCVATQMRPFPLQMDPHRAASARSLISNQLFLPQTLSPKWAERAVGGAGHRILCNSRPRRKEPRDKIEVWVV